MLPYFGSVPLDKITDSVFCRSLELRRTVCPRLPLGVGFPDELIAFFEQFGIVLF